MGSKPWKREEKGSPVGSTLPGPSGRNQGETRARGVGKMKTGRTERKSSSKTVDAEKAGVVALSN